MTNLSGNTAAALGAAILASFLPGVAGDLALSVAIALSLAYFLAGLAVVHALARGTSGRGVILSVFYALLVLLVAASAAARQRIPALASDPPYALPATAAELETA